MKTVFCLFSIENQYDQPSNNLEAVWLTKPSFKELEEAVKTLGEGVEEDILLSILNGEEERIWNWDYRLQEVTVGKILE